MSTSNEDNEEFKFEGEEDEIMEVIVEHSVYEDGVRDNENDDDDGAEDEENDDDDDDVVVVVDNKRDRDAESATYTEAEIGKLL